MAELAIRSLSGTHRTLHATLGRGRAMVSLDKMNAVGSLAEVAVRGYDASRDLLYEIPASDALDRTQLAWELDSHIPPLLSVQTDAHWFASSIPGYVLIQPIQVSATAVSPLEALSALAIALTGDSILLQCDEGSLLAIEVVGSHALVHGAGMGIEEFTQVEEAARQRILPLRNNCHVLLSGSEASAAVSQRLSQLRSHTFELIGPQHLLAAADIDAQSLKAMAGNEAEYALAIGVAAALAEERERVIVVR